MNKRHESNALGVIAVADDTLVEVASQMCHRLFQRASKANPIHFVLAGGTSPKAVYSAWTKFGAIEWQHVHFYFGDERCVGPDDALSNYRMFREAFLDVIEGELPTVHRILGEERPKAAAAAYANTIAACASFDGALLGIGADCHTASLFPDSAQAPSDSEVETLVVERADAVRVSLHYNALRRCRSILFYVPGEKKVDALKEMLLRGPKPASRVALSTSSVVVCSERCAALLEETEAKEALAKALSTGAVHTSFEERAAQRPATS